MKGKKKVSSITALFLFGCAKKSFHIYQLNWFKTAADSASQTLPFLHSHPRQERQRALRYPPAATRPAQPWERTSLCSTVQQVGLLQQPHQLLSSSNSL